MDGRIHEKHPGQAKFNIQPNKPKPPVQHACQRVLGPKTRAKRSKERDFHHHESISKTQARRPCSHGLGRGIKSTTRYHCCSCASSLRMHSSMISCQYPSLIRRGAYALRKRSLCFLHSPPCKVNAERSESLPLTSSQVLAQANLVQPLESRAWAAPRSACDCWI